MKNQTSENSYGWLLWGKYPYDLFLHAENDLMKTEGKITSAYGIQIKGVFIGIMIGDPITNVTFKNRKRAG